LITFVPNMNNRKASFLLSLTTLLSLWSTLFVWNAYSKTINDIEFNFITKQNSVHITSTFSSNQKNNTFFCEINTTDDDTKFSIAENDEDNDSEHFSLLNNFNLPTQKHQFLAEKSKRNIIKNRFNFCFSRIPLYDIFCVYRI